jgi:hypothetical protein
VSQPISINEFFERLAELGDRLAAEDLEDLSDSELAAEIIGLRRLIDRAKEICAAAERAVRN